MTGSPRFIHSLTVLRWTPSSLAASSTE